VSLERLWAGWRADYVGSVGPPELDAADCLFCGLVAADPIEAGVVARDDHTFAVINAYPYTSGHLMVAPLAHGAELEALPPDDASALMAMTQRAVVAVKAAYGPAGVNVGMNLGRAAGAGVPGHLHVHVVPRWVGDTNFMTALAETRVLPEDLRTTADRLRAAWPS
jgi:ATP adenylyltransferase